MSKIFKTKAGTELLLMDLKGKSYMQVAYRLQWFVEENPNYSIETNYLTLTDEQCVAHTTVTLFDKDNKINKRVTGTKKETKKDFADFVEKAETGSLGRCMILLGYGTQYALADLDEGTRLADSPLESVKKDASVTPIAKPSFRKAAPKAENTALQNAINDGAKTDTGSNTTTRTSATTGWE